MCRVDWGGLQFIREREWAIEWERETQKGNQKKKSRVLGLGLVLDTGSGSPYGVVLFVCASDKFDLATTVI